jgi:hypothetical protein
MHETEAAKLRPETRAPIEEPTADELLPLLDDALAKLTDADRTAVVRRFLQGQSFGQVGSAMGCTEEAARKRVGRAVEKLRAILMKQGLVPSVGGLMVVLAAQQSPHASAAVVANAITAISTNPTGTNAAIAKGVLSMMTSAQIKLLAVVAVMLLITGGLGAGISILGPARGQSAATEQVAPVPVNADLNAGPAKSDQVIVNEKELLPFESISEADVNNIFGRLFSTQPVASQLPERLRQALVDAAFHRIHFCMAGDAASYRATINAGGQFWWKTELSPILPVPEAQLKAAVSGVVGGPYTRIGFPDQPLTVRVGTFAKIMSDYGPVDSHVKINLDAQLIFATVWIAEKLTTSPMHREHYRCSETTFVCDPTDAIPAFAEIVTRDHRPLENPARDLPNFMRGEFPTK